MKLLLTLLLGLGLAQEDTTYVPTTRGFTVDWQFEEGTTAVPTQDPEEAAKIIEKQIEADKDPNTKNRKRSKGSSSGPPARGPPVRGPPVRGPPMRGPPTAFAGRRDSFAQATQAPLEAPTEPATTILQTTEPPTTFSAEKPKPVQDAGQYQADEQQLTSSGLDRSGPRRLGPGGRPSFGMPMPGRPGPGDRGLQSPAQLLAEELGLSIGAARRCWICKNAKSNSECLQKGTYATCRKNESCQTETRWENGFLKINSQCKQRNACTVATKQTKQCDGMKGKSGRTCWRCCHHDFCNLDDIDPKNY